MKIDLEEEILRLNHLKERFRSFEKSLDSLVVLGDDSKETKKKYNNYVKSKRKNFKKAILKCKIDCLYAKFTLFLARLNIITVEKVNSNLIHNISTDLFHAGDIAKGVIPINLDNEQKDCEYSDPVALFDALLEETNEEKVEMLKVKLRGIEKREALNNKLANSLAMQNYKMDVTKNILSLGGTI